MDGRAGFEVALLAKASTSLAAILILTICRSSAVRRRASAMRPLELRACDGVTFRARDGVTSRDGVTLGPRDGVTLDIIGQSRGAAEVFPPRVGVGRLALP